MIDDLPPALIELREHSRKRLESLRNWERVCAGEAERVSARRRGNQEEVRYKALLGELRDGKGN